MKTRVIQTSIWDDDTVYNLNIDTKLLYLVLLTNPYIGQSRIYKINDRQISTYSGLNVDQLQKCKKDLEKVGKALFREGYVCITGKDLVDSSYTGEKNEVAKNKEIAAIPADVLKYFKGKMDTLSIPYPYTMDTPINNKSYIINNKDTDSEEKNDIPEVDQLDTNLLFEEWWAIFPASKRMAKQDCKKKYVKGLTLEEHKRRVSHLKDQRERDRKWLGGFIPNITTYINQKRWDTEVEIDVRQSQSVTL